MRHSRWMMISNIRKEDYYKENGGVIFPNPNAPTGVEASQEMIEDILQHNQDVIVIIDEAYVDFGARTAQPLLEKYDNLIVVQTIFKITFHGGNAHWICHGITGTDQISE